MSKAIYPGSFDPTTFGHLDIISRSAKLADELVVGVLVNQAKAPMFTIEERVQMLEYLTKEYGNVTVVAFEGLLVDFARRENADRIIRGLRAVTDFEYELQMAQTNHILEDGIDTIFLTTRLEYSYLSSSIVKEVALLGGDISQFVPPYVIEQIHRKISIKN